VEVADREAETDCNVGGGGAALVTVNASVPLTPPSAAVIVPEPAAAPVTSPVPDTVAVDGAELVKVTPAATHVWVLESE